ncbi:Na+/H+ antiporter subunit G [Marinobacter subterrani]|uniref:Na+/H+ antiporter subunit G n=1 Tax=Marinobacter subterrani TaxID=1658765 RepID=UPI00235463A6|nr:Na+/H+ antiporter subunit G [Marinobacter subterrani]
MSQISEYLVSALLLLGGAFTLIGALGLLRLPDFYTRLHAPTKATTLGVGAIMLSSVVYFSNHDQQLGFSETLITVFLFLTAPVSANILAKAAMHIGVKPVRGTRGRPWEQ